MPSELLGTPGTLLVQESTFADLETLQAVYNCLRKTDWYNTSIKLLGILLGTGPDSSI